MTLLSCEYNKARRKEARAGIGTDLAMKQEFRFRKQISASIVHHCTHNTLLAACDKLAAELQSSCFIFSFPLHLLGYFKHL